MSVSIAAILIALASPMHHPATPVEAALSAVYAGPSHIRVVRVNVAGSYATVLLQGAMMEGQTQTSPILVERFPFGWQAVDALTVRCRLTSRHLGASTEKRLLRSMPSPSNQPACWGETRDAGPAVDVLALRRQATELLVPSVRVSGRYGVVDWYGSGGGQTLYQKTNGQWHLIQGGGGVLDIATLRAHQVPENAWCTLAIYDRSCGRAPRD